jgi:hypothetical protein
MRGDKIKFYDFCSVAVSQHFLQETLFHFQRDLKKFSCKKHREGNCEHGDSCQYSHEDDIADSSAESLATPDADD